MDIKQRFHQLTEREQRLTLIAAVAVVIGLFYFVVWAPLNQSLEQNRKAVTTQQSLLTWVQKNANKAIQLRGSGIKNQVFSGSLPQTVNQTASRLQIVISRMQPQGDEIQVWVDQAPFNDLLSWLQNLEKAGIRILDVDIAESDTPGSAKIRKLQLGK